MPEYNTRDAAEIVGVSHTMIWEYVKDGRLTARRQGIRGIIRIDADDLRRFAEEYDFRFNEALAAQLADS